MELAEQVYYSLIGELVEEAELSWVENAYSPGSSCDSLYRRFWESRERLADRLGIPEDPDVECMIDSLMQIQKELCLKMFACGIRRASEAGCRTE